MPSSAKQNSVDDSSSDLACTRCRERKIRCGRERPACGNCEKEADANCEYKQPVKRVNHLKLLCDSVELLQSRLTSIESCLRQPNSSLKHSRSGSITSRATRDLSADAESSEEEYADELDIDEDLQPDSYRSSLHISRNETEKIDRWHGPASLYVLCNRLRLKASDKPGLHPHTPHMEQVLQNLCDDAGATEQFPSFTTRPLNHLVPKQQALAAIDAFFAHLDYATDIFDKSNLLYNVERIYSSPLKPQDEVWAVCFRTLVLLVVAREISSKPAHGNNQGLFGDFARTFLPSRAGLVNSQLLTQPRLINVQVLILLSIATQQFDPLDWTELLFTHACIIARTMGLQNAQVCVSEDGAPESIEKAKVLRALYCRDRNLFTSFGSTPWLLTSDDTLRRKFGAAVEQSIPYSDRIRLAMIQDETYTALHALDEMKSYGKGRSLSALNRIDRQLRDFSTSVDLFRFPPDHPSCSKLLMLEFLNTRILAFQRSKEPRHREQVLRDARASCCLLLISAGIGSSTMCEQFALDVGLRCAETPTEPMQELKTSSEPSDGAFTTLLDAFSAPAFFALFESCLDSMDTYSPPSVPPDTTRIKAIDLLRGVTTCYAHDTARHQGNNYNRKAAHIYGRLLSFFDSLSGLRASTTPPASNVAPVANMLGAGIMASTASPTQMPPLQHTNSDTSSTFSTTPSMSSTSCWDGLFSPNTFLDSMSIPLPDQMNLDLFSGTDFVLDNFVSLDWNTDPTAMAAAFSGGMQDSDAMMTPNLKRRRTSVDPNHF